MGRLRSGAVRRLVAVGNGASRSPSAQAEAAARTATTAYDGAMTFVGSSRVCQSTTASATPTGAR